MLIISLTDRRCERLAVVTRKVHHGREGAAALRVRTESTSWRRTCKGVLVSLNPVIVSAHCPKAGATAREARVRRAAPDTTARHPFSQVRLSVHLRGFYSTV